MRLSAQNIVDLLLDMYCWEGLWSRGAPSATLCSLFSEEISPPGPPFNSGGFESAAVYCANLERYASAARPCFSRAECLCSSMALTLRSQTACSFWFALIACLWLGVRDPRLWVGPLDMMRFFPSCVFLDLGELYCAVGSDVSESLAVLSWFIVQA